MILTYEKQQLIKPVATNDIERFEQVMEETEMFELSKLIGQDVYDEINENQVKYSDLINGCVFSVNGKSVTHKGLNYVIAYLNFANYVEESQVFDTYTGLVRKKREDSESVGNGTVKNLRDKNKEIAMYHYSFVKEYMKSIGLFKTESRKVKFLTIKNI